MEDSKIKLKTSKSRQADMMDKATPTPKGTLSEGRKPRRTIVPPKPNPAHISSEAMIIPHLDSLLNDSLVIIGTELSRYRAKTARGASLELKEARALQGYMDTLVKLSKESREQAKYEDFANMSDEELLALAAKQLNGIEDKSDSNE